ncbi:hypothetical protein GCM10009734_22180 [Nonomuraea bangladeshensis]
MGCLLVRLMSLAATQSVNNKPKQPQRRAKRAPYQSTQGLAHRSRGAGGVGQAGRARDAGGAGAARRGEERGQGLGGGGFDVAGVALARHTVPMPPAPISSSSV